jgi:cytochrome c biogenesis protein CcdA
LHSAGSPVRVCQSGSAFPQERTSVAGRHGFTFAGFAAIATVGGAWVVRANQYGRIASLVVLAVFGLTLLWPALADRLSRPFVQLGSRLSQPSDSGAKPSPLRSLLLGVATGLLWAPCAGPILGLILTGAALEGASSRSAFLLLAYAAGAATSLAVALLAGGRCSPRSSAPWERKSGYAASWACCPGGRGSDCVRAGSRPVDANFAREHVGSGTIADRPFSSGCSASKRSLPKRQQKNPGGMMMMMSSTAPGAAAGPQMMPDLSGAVAWLNSPPLNRDQLKGHVVLVDFWTYSCINCLRSIPYVRAWADKYKDSGLIVIGVHTPEFAFEKDLDNVRRAVAS